MKKLIIKSMMILLYCLAIIQVISMLGVSPDTSMLSLAKEKILNNFNFSFINDGETKEDSITTKEVVKTSAPITLYLSDLPYYNLSSSENILYDKNYNNELLSLNIDDNNMNFNRGIMTLAPSSITYDLKDYDYDYFIAYVGINSPSYAAGNINISVSNDRLIWRELSNTTLTSSSNAKYIKVSIKGYNYLKLTTESGYTIYADAKLLKDSYTEYTVKPIAKYDEEIKSNYNGKDITEDLELLILQREFTSYFGENELRVLFAENEAYFNTFNKLLNDKELLKLYIMGGKPDGSYTESIRVLSSLFTSYPLDLNDKGVSYTGVVLNNIYKKMMISLSLTHSKEVEFWVNSATGSDVIENANTNISSAIERYNIYKEMLLEGSLNYVFERLEVEEMRYIMGSQINDDEIKWLRAYAKTKNDSKSAYGYMSYVNINPELYSNELYFANDISVYENKYMLKGYKIANQKYFPRLWMIFDVGGTYWQIANAGQNVVSSLGIPSTIIGYEDKTAYIAYKEPLFNQGTWEIIDNDNSWQDVNTLGYNDNRGYYEVRLLNSWGNGEYTSLNPGAYILLSQEALNDYNNYVASTERIILGNIYSDQATKEREYKNAIKMQKINFAAWLNLVNLYVKDNTKTEEDLYTIAKEITDAFNNNPVPMHDLLNLLKTKITTNEYKISIDALEYNTLKNKDDNIAKYVVNNIDSNIATFTFEDNAIKISYEIGSWEYSLDDGLSWQEVNEQTAYLTEEEINSITAENDIKIHMMNTPKNEDTIYTIDITKNDSPKGLSANEYENRVMGNVDKLEYSEDGITWTAFADAIPDLRGSKTLLVRKQKVGTSLASEPVSLTFTEFGDKNINEDGSEDLTHKYIPISNMRIDYTKASPSSEIYETLNKQKDLRAIYAIDGNINTYWQTALGDEEKAIIIKLNDAKKLSRLEYIRGEGYEYGALKTGTIYLSIDGDTWEEVSTIEGCTDTLDYNIKTASFIPQEATYVKLVFNETLDSYASVGMINLYEDITGITKPTADILYSNLTPTNNSVTATITNLSEDTEILGDPSFTFTENGTHEFIIYKVVDDVTITNSVYAKVDWIDKKAPTATISYSKTSATNEDIITTISFDEPVEIISKDIPFKEYQNNILVNLTTEDNLKYIINKNSDYTLEFIDKAGNLGTLKINVNWIDRTYPNATIEYSNNKATLKTNEYVTILNNNGSNVYTFNKNGAFTFVYMDNAGNIASKKATISWLKENKDVSIKYSTVTSTTNAVIATLTSNQNLKVLNNNGNMSYTFTKNGDYKFSYVDEYGVVSSITAKVNWINNKNTPVVNPDPITPTPDNKPNNEINDNPVIDTPNINEPFIDNNEIDNTITDDDSSNKDTPSEEQETKTKWISYADSIKVQVNTDANVFLKYKALDLDDDLKSKVGASSSYFKLEIKDNIGFNYSPEEPIKVNYNVPENKNVSKVYFVSMDKELTEINFKKAGTNSIEFETEKVGKFIVKYDANKTTNKLDKNQVLKEETPEEDAKVNIKIPAIIIAITLLVFGGLNFAHYRYKKKRKTVSFF